MEEQGQGWSRAGGAAGAVRGPEALRAALEKTSAPHANPEGCRRGTQPQT